ncbi:tetratricopeptide repeat protein [Actinomyces sp. oral taxon 414]|uniref:tetratricopeptide repeat protein n=1 Tax=Actinomyces sp. oral taxon 414 TaxID=712122 RepID=UPI0006AE5386|nr:tetratricopeptide repeat protein [Actinomyces sp. oral taxon 414]
MVAFSLVPLGTRLAVFLLRASDAVADPSPSGAVALIEEVRAGWRGIAALRGRGDEAVDSFGGRIASRLEAEVADARRRCEERGVNAGLLRGAMTEVEVLLEELAKDDAVVVAAVRDPDRFRDVIRGRVQRRRRNVEEAAEPFFDALVRAVTGEFVFLVLGSANFRIGALRQLLDGVDAIQVGFEGVKTEQEEQTAHFDGRFDRIEDAEELVPRRPSRVRFGSRPMEVSGFVERREQAGLFGAVLSGAAGRTVLTGMRGSGKSQLATAVAARCEAQDWELVAWVPAGSREAVLSGLAGLGLELGVRVENGSSHEVIAQHCLTALASAQESNRLIVFDDVDSPDDLAGLVPRGEGVRVLVTTTRLADWEHDGWAHVPVGVFEREQSIGILLDRTNQSDREAADGIAEALGDLPVAVVQAAATARRGRYTLAAYLDVLERTTLEEAVRRREGDEYPEAVGVALQLAFQSALERTALKTGVQRREEGEYPEAVGVALWLAFQGALERIGDRSPHREVVARVQLGVLSVLAATGVPARWLEALDGGAGDAREALSELIESSVCRLSEDGSKVMIRELQSRVIREAWKDEPASWGRVEEAAAGLLETVDITAIPIWDSGRRRREVLDLVEQLRATAGQDYSRSLFSRPRTAGALTHALRYAVELGDPQAALSLSDAVDLLDETLGSDHPDALAARGGLAAAYQAADRLEQAIFLFERTLTDSEHILGSDHPHTLTSRGNLATAYEIADRLEQAIDLFERTLTDSEHILGPNHPHTLTSRGNLANTYWSAGRRDEAIDLYEQNLADRERFLGPDHSCTLTSRDDLAYAYQSAGRLDKAVPLFEQILADRERRLGSDHTSTRLFRKKLADAYRTVGRDEDAEALLDPPPAFDDAEADRPDD